jgi:hypothetical protein
MNKLKAVLGITNKTEDNKYIPFFDFDIQDVDLVDMDLRRIRDIHKLSYPFIIKSNNGFNAFFLDKLTFDECIRLCGECRYIDDNFVKYAIKKCNFTLRTGKDKKFCNFLNPCNIENELSYAHYLYFNEFFHVDILNGVQITDLNFDKSEELQIVMYMSKKYGYIEVD